MIQPSFKEDLAFVMNLIKLELQSKLEAQGHGRKGSSKLIDSMEVEIISTANFLVANMLMEDYYVFVEKGVKASRIPYRRGSGRRRSKYIDALIRHWQRKGLSRRAAKSAAFATANVHKKEGMPTKASFRFSRDGTRTGFLSSTLKNYEETAFRILERQTGNSVEMALTTFMIDLQQGIN